MIRLVEVKNFRSLKYISQSLEDFQVLVGANASGKTTFLDVIGFVSDLLQEGVDEAITKRTNNYMDLTFGGEGGDIEIALELEIPEDFQKQMPIESIHRIRYSVRVGLSKETEEHAILAEHVLLLDSRHDPRNEEPVDKYIFPHEQTTRKAVVYGSPEILEGKNWIYPLVLRSHRGATNYFDEKYIVNGRPTPSVATLGIGVKKSALGSIPIDTKPDSLNWLRNFLSSGVQKFQLDSLHMRQSSAPGQPRKFKTDGSNLPWVIEDLKKNNPEAFRNWIMHIQTALRDVEDIIVIDREDDRHRYLKIRYDNGIEVPSWMVSDGTLRLLALTLPAYLPDFSGIYLIEEPENGIHPRAIETTFQSLSSVYHAQILLATHSPVILSMVKLKDILCFAKTANGVTDIVNGTNHPALADWKKETSLGTLFASGVLS